ncbi:hypothetical protein A2U01_0058227, partial [Trifolium medium]|nr:hypothetical protein [Trifolium medium]
VSCAARKGSDAPRAALFCYACFFSVTGAARMVGLRRACYVVVFLLVLLVAAPRAGLCCAARRTLVCGLT